MFLNLAHDKNQQINRKLANFSLFPNPWESRLSNTAACQLSKSRLRHQDHNYHLFNYTVITLK